MTNTPILAAEGLQLRYGNGALGVINVSVRVEVAQLVAILGPNGAGKTSTVRAMSGFLPTENAKVTRGSVYVDGHNVTNSLPHRYAKFGVSFIPERRKIFPNLTVQQNMRALGISLNRDERASAEKKVLDLFPELAPRLKDYAGQLSGGQRQMLALARGFLTRPKVIIVDEMSLGLHHSVQPRLFAAVKAIVESGTSVVLVDESVGLNLEIADYCYLITGGRIRAQGTPEQVSAGTIISDAYVDA
jgi:branched-chain amino acid transport system ATP-binding protein